jgi:hypothetical protein
MTASSHPLLASAALQDDLLIALNDLERLQTLIDHSHEALQAGFFGLVAQLDTTPQRDAAQGHLKDAMKALQFQDMATQLLAHTGQRLRHCADRVACDAFAGDADGDAVVEQPPLRPNPVTQAELDTGFVELF